MTSRFLYRRRDFIAGLSAVVWPTAARPQQRAVPVIGILYAGALTGLQLGDPESPLVAFHQSLAEAGFIVGRNVLIEYRWADEQYDRLPLLAADLVRSKADVIVTPEGTQATLAAKAATQTIPILFSVGADPVDIKLVARLNHPGGNLTGVSLLNNAVAAKRLELLHDLVPGATSLAYLDDPTNTALSRNEIQRAARILGIDLIAVTARNEREIERAFEKFALKHADGVVVSASSLNFTQRQKIALLAIRYKMPIVSQWRECTTAGGLMSYGIPRPEGYRIIGAYTGRILRGEKAADLPVQQVTKVELTINMKTAKALGLTFPLTLLGRADEVIE